MHEITNGVIKYSGKKLIRNWFFFEKITIYRKISKVDE